LVNALVFNGKAVVARRGFRPKIFDDCQCIAVFPQFYPLWLDQE